MTIKRIGNLALCMTVVLGITMGSTARGAANEPAAGQDPPPAQQSMSESATQSELAPQPDDGEPYANGLVGDCPTCDSDVDCGCLVGPMGRYWFRADYLLWWTRGSYVPPLVTTSTDPDDSGILGRPTTSILFGGERIDQGDRANVRLRWGGWLDCGRSTGVEFELFSLGRGETPFSFTSSGSPLLARPFYNVVTGEQAAELVSHPDYLEGTIDGRVSEYFHSGGVNLRLNMCCQECCCQDVCDEELFCGGGECSRAEVYASRLRGLLRRHWRPDRYRVDLIAGYRAYRLNDSLNVHEDLETFGPVPGKPYIGIPTRFVVDDVFRSRNEFNGGELGMIAQFYRGRWSLELLAKIGVGNNRQNVSISGHTAITDPEGTTVEYDGGLLALEGTNIGHYAQNDFVVIPQLGVEFGYQVSCHVRAYVGYNLLYWANVARAAEQIDTSINPTYIPGQGVTPSGELRPAFAFHNSDFWAQGLNAGLEWRF